MDPLILGLIIVAALAAIGVFVMSKRKQERQRLEQRFGPEYEHQVQAAGGSRSKAEAALLKREKRVQQLDIRPLQPAERDAFQEQWLQVQARFVDDPPRAIAFADALVADVMKARGYPIEDFEQRAGDISVENPEIVSNYRAAHEIARRHKEGKADTEDLRHAFVGYRALFEELLRAERPELTH